MLGQLLRDGWGKMTQATMKTPALYDGEFVACAGSINDESPRVVEPIKKMLKEKGAEHIIVTKVEGEDGKTYLRYDGYKVKK